MTDRDEYFEKARSWAVDAQVREVGLRRIAWTVAGIATAVALFEAVALALLTPLKTVQPITLLVDRQTGFVQALDPLRPRKISADAALTQSFLAQYVAAREGFDRATIAYDYRRVALWSAGLARAQYLAVMPASNPESPLQRFSGGAKVLTRIKSVSPLADGMALVRFDTALQDRTGSAGPSQPWISVVRYRYSDAPMAFEDRLVNPLGFQVTSYRRDAEALPPPPSPTAPESASNAASAARVALAPIVTPEAISRQRRQRQYADRIVLRGIPFNQIPLGSPLDSHPDAIDRATPSIDRSASDGHP